ncbi:MAG: GTPase ObgE [Ignavibacteria bacterium]|nr:GTPase ObgE [Ignavibacteria bacterium]
MQFIDQASIYVKAGNGGNGVISFRREKFVPKGGPDGGNGGNGGSVHIRADRQLSTLLDFKYKRHYKAENGEHGRGKTQTGRNGSDVALKVPCGTLVLSANNREIIADLVADGDEVVVAQGGKGGRGNAEFATPTNQAPRIAEPGTPGEERFLLLELKLLADVGLVGFPNAGKSTLISVVSAARPKIADYPFTTLSPNLGIVRYGEGRSFTLADMPGLVKGAHAGKGLGIQFLRHIERTKVLVIMIESVSENPKRDHDILLNELESFNPDLARKPRIVALTKIDLFEKGTTKRLRRMTFGRKVPVVLISAATGEGIGRLLDEMWRALKGQSPVTKVRRGSP